MSFAARTMGGPLIVELTLTPGFEGIGNTKGYQSGRSGPAIGSVSPDAANIFGARLNGLYRFPNASFDIVHLDTEAVIPIEYGNVDVYVAGAFWVRLTLLNNNTFRTLVSPDVFTVGVPALVRLEFRK